MKIVSVGSDRYLIPDFIIDFEDKPHHFKGNLKRHLTIESILFKLSWLLVENDAIIPLQRLWQSILSLFFGLNCNFPRGKIALYVWWSLTKGYYEAL